ncbi:hypothetical protein RJ527_08795 [Thalassospiraceae bacterium LMO-SO8]|nr:hypothetical protein [Alphaproteobacteria bacterium LMO-S08]WND77828.1 hypothetical protein RJ527_08795 [Thalassospiraceae bacterium LMO-SO8]
MATTPDYLGARNSQCTIITNGDGTTAQIIFTAGANGARVHLVSASTDDATPSLTLMKSDGTTSCILATFQLPTNSGRVNGAPAVDLLDPSVIPSIPADPGRFLTLGAGETLAVAMTTTLTVDKTVHVVADGVDY